MLSLEILILSPLRSTAIRTFAFDLTLADRECKRLDDGF